MRPGMTKVIVGYPAGEGNTFDRDYYLSTHIPLVRERIGDALRGSMVEYGIGGAAPGSEAPYMTLVTMYFDNVEAFQQSFGPHAQEIMSDIPNFTNVEPVVQVSEIAELVAGGN